MTSTTPKQMSWTYVLEALSPISHHDPAVQDDSNRLLLNRQRQILTDPVAGHGRAMSADELEALAKQEPVPLALADLFDDISAAEFVAIAFTRRFIALYGRGEGSGLFAGLERYQMLEQRMRHAAVASPTLRAYWDRLCDTLQVAISGGKGDQEILSLLTVPPTLQQATLRAIERDYRSIVMLARVWATETKMQVQEYADAAGEAVAEATTFTLDLPMPSADEEASAVIAEVPAVSANSLRHVMVRRPVWYHLVEALGLPAAKPGEGTLPPGVEALFSNGGYIRAGAKRITGSWALAHEIRQRYPSLDLLGGVTDSFDLGASRLRVGAWLVCSENVDALEAIGLGDQPNAAISVYDMLDDVTHVRQASAQGEGQMIYSFETLCPGTQIAVRLSVDPFTPDVTVGALETALAGYADGPHAGGQGARGFGWLQVARAPELNGHAAAYGDYISGHASDLRAGMEDGTLGTGRQVVS